MSFTFRLISNINFKGKIISKHKIMYYWEKNRKDRNKYANGKAEIAQLLYGQPRGWKIGVRFPAGASDFTHLHIVQTGTGAHPASYIMSTRGSFPGGKRPDVKLTTHLHLVPRSKTVELYLHSLIRLHGVMLNKLSTKTTLRFKHYKRWRNEIQRIKLHFRAVVSTRCL
jgi:hypothetical protein